MIDKDRDSNENLMVMRADLMRRTGMFIKLIKEYSKVKLKDEMLNKIISFEIKRAKRFDTKCYRVEDVPGWK